MSNLTLTEYETEESFDFELEDYSDSEFKGEVSDILDKINSLDNSFKNCTVDKKEYILSKISSINNDSRKRERDRTIKRAKDRFEELKSDRDWMAISIARTRHTIKKEELYDVADEMRSFLEFKGYNITDTDNGFILKNKRIRVELKE